MNLKEKIEHSKELIKEALEKYPMTTLACSWGKDSMVLLHLALQVKPDIDVFTVLTKFKPPETFEYADKLTKDWNLNIKRFMEEKEYPLEFPAKYPDACCHLLKVMPTLDALKGKDCWITGLRNTEGRTRLDYKEIEKSEDIVKLNPILVWTEDEIWKYMHDNNIPIHPWYLKELPQGKRYRSLGCEPCTIPILPNQEEREGRWAGTSKCGGECGIHTYHKK